uniref:Integrase, catalytic region, zinc finger, CCHC-type, peptidase aspartic, catalytic n=1 Tax=Tanacetum cinerariifolium TaxID=118510 RepID=A0A699IH39_TANCI|nr:hypothetical protein [Tanacetum cinerariifolium]
MIISGADNRPLMLEKSMYDSWKSRMELYIENKENRRMILNSVLNGPLVWPTVVEENDEEQLAFLTYPGIPDGQAAQTTILNTTAFQTKVLDAYDFDYDDVPNAKAVLMTNLSKYGSAVISEEKDNHEKNTESLTVELERYKE